MDAITHEDFRRLILTEFPALAEEIEDSDGLLHIETGWLAIRAQEAKGKADWTTCKHIMTVVDRVFATEIAVP